MHINIPRTNQERIVIVGAGFAGIQLARKLSKKDFQIVLFDRYNYHQFQPLFYQVAMAGLEPSSISFPLRKAFQSQKNVFIRVAELESIDHQQKKIFTEIGDIEYDRLVIATGVDTNYFGNENLRKYVIPMKSVGEALMLRNAILKDYEHAVMTSDYEQRQKLIDIVIVGGGPTGVEVAGALAEMKKYILPKDYPELNIEEIDIYLIQGSDRLLEGMSEISSVKAREFLEDLGVIVKTNTRVNDYDGEFVYMQDGSKIPANKVIWAAGVTGKWIEGLPEVSQTRGNRICVDEYNQVKGCEHIYALGDIACMQNEENHHGHPQVAQVAIQQAKNLYKNILLEKDNKAKIPFQYKDLGTMATIGRNRAVVDLPKWKTQGFFAWLIWMVVHLYALIGVKNRLFVFINWIWNYFTYDQSLRLIIKAKSRPEKKLSE